MSDKSKQNISELMDGELPNDCSRFLLKRMQSDEVLQSSWNNYHMLRSCLQQENDAPLMENLGASVVRQLSSNAEVQPIKSNRFNGWMKSLTGTAIAASVALVAIFTFNQNQSIPNSEPQLVYAKTSQQVINPPNATAVRVEQPLGFTRYPSLTPQIQHYYNVEYVNRMINQSRLKAQQNTAEE